MLVSFSRGSSSWSSFLAIFVVFILTLDTTLASLSARGKSTATTHPSTTKKTTTKKSTTHSTTTTSHKTTTTKTTKSSTSTVKSYTWKSVTSRANCPTFVPTSTLVAPTSTVSGAVVTGFLDLYGGNAPLQMATNLNTSNADNVLFKINNGSSIMMFKPAKYVMIIDNTGVLVYDDKCAQGARLSLPGLFDGIGSSSSTSSPAPSATRSPALSQQLVRRASTTQTFHVYFTLVDECGGPAENRASNPVAYFDVKNGLFAFPGQVKFTDGGNGNYDAQITAPYVHSDACEAAFNKIKDFLNDPLNVAARGYADLIKKISEYAGPFIATGAVETFLAGLGVGGTASFLVEVVGAYGVLALFSDIGGLDYLKNEMCTKDLISYTLKADISGDPPAKPGYLVDYQNTNPFINRYLDLTFPRPADQQCPGCPNFSYNSTNCGSCGNVCNSHEYCRLGVCTVVYPPCGPVYHPGDGTPKSDNDCYCFQSDAGYTFYNVDLFCKNLPSCSVTSDCTTGNWCAIENCCGRGVCLDNNCVPSSKGSKSRRDNMTTEAREILGARAAGDDPNALLYCM